MPRPLVGIELRQLVGECGVFNGPLEGHITRLKLIKRSVFDRANFDLLRLRVLYRA